MLTIYRASAGAGKTHNLTGQYLALLMKSPQSYKGIMAVTFTNKATDEMKGRIIEELYFLASSRKSAHLAGLMEVTDLSEREVRRRSKELLINILHDYSMFNVSTIDHFFQITLRSFARELGLQGGYELEMDSARVLTEAIDSMLSHLQKKENKPLLNWLIRFTENKMEEGKKWTLEQDIQKLGMELFKESYRNKSEAIKIDIADKNTLEVYHKELIKIIKTTNDEAHRLGKEGLKVMDDYGLKPEDFSGKSKSQMKVFSRLAENGIAGVRYMTLTPTFLKFPDNIEVWYAKSTPKEQIPIFTCVYEQGLNKAVKEVISLFEDLIDYNTARVINSNYFSLGILTDLTKEIAAWREENNAMLISDTNDLLAKVINGSEAPFIYEKTGTRIDHFMIDEFQDTSHQQWDNFRPLIEESLSQGHDNLIVGDVKQSIYRFRNSDWELLDQQVEKDFFPSQLRMCTLGDNWRSCRGIVEFNNEFFDAAPHFLQECFNKALKKSSLSEEEQQYFASRIEKAYANNAQQVPDKFKDKEGHVQITYLTQEEDETWKEQALKALPSTLEKLQDQGYALRDVAFLTRTNKEGMEVATTLLEYAEANVGNGYHYDIISDESLFIGSSRAVRFLLHILAYIEEPSDKANFRLAETAFARLCEKPLDTPFPPELLKALARLGLTLYENIEELFRLFSPYFKEEDQVYLQAFMDTVLEFTNRGIKDINHFLEWWDQTGYNKSISIPDGQDAARILTIHKSKGLGFKVVIIPFASWEIDHVGLRSPLLWCYPKKEPFNKLSTVPIRYSSQLIATHFSYEYFEESLYTYIDSLNTLYVAFTRAKEELIVFAPQPKVMKKGNFSDSISTIGRLIFELTKSWHTETPLCYEKGTWWKPNPAEEENKMEEEEMKRVLSISPNNRLELRLQHKGYALDDEQRRYGTLMHDMLGQVKVPEDIPHVITGFSLRGLINQKEKVKIEQELKEWLNKPEVKPWFDGSGQVLNEIDILTDIGEAKRPDRVIIKEDRVTVVDYKFGYKEEKKYFKQIRMYVRLINQMGYKHVEGYLWYLELDKIIRVK